MESASPLPYRAAPQSAKRQLLHILLFASFLSFAPCYAQAQQRVLDVGIRLQKTINLYYENGLSIQYSSNKLAGERLYFGLSYISSRLGSAMASNAIRQDNFLLSGAYFLRPAKVLRPMFRASTGYFSAPLDPIFDDLPQSSMLLSTEAGLCIDPRNPLKITSSIGYNFITGDGLKGPGTLYPAFIQTSLSWDVFHNKATRP